MQVWEVWKYGWKQFAALTGALGVLVAFVTHFTKIRAWVFPPPEALSIVIKDVRGIKHGTSATVVDFEIHAVLTKTGDEPLFCQPELRLGNVMFKAEHRRTVFEAKQSTQSSTYRYRSRIEEFSNDAELRVNCRNFHQSGASLPVTDWVRVQFPKAQLGK